MNIQEIQLLPYDSDSVQHTYGIGEFTYWCGGWVTAYYNTNDDTVIEAGSVVIGTMNEALVDAFSDLNGQIRMQKNHKEILVTVFREIGWFRL